MKIEKVTQRARELDKLKQLLRRIGRDVREIKAACHDIELELGGKDDIITLNDLPTRVFKILKNGGRFSGHTRLTPISRWSQLTTMTENDVIAYGGMGPVRMDELRAALKSRGLSLLGE